MSKKRLLTGLLAVLVLSVGAFVSSFAWAGTEEERSITVLDGSSVAGPVMLTNPNTDTLSVSTLEYFGSRGASVRYNLSEIGPNVARGFHLFPKTDLSGYDSLQIVCKSTEVIELGFFGYQLFLDGADPLPDGSNVKVVETSARPTAEWQTIAVDVSTYRQQMDNVGRIIFSCNVVEGREAATTLYIDSINAVQTKGEGAGRSVTLFDAASLYGIGLSNAANDIVAMAADGSLQYEISKTGPDVGRGIHFFPRMSLKGIEAIEITCKTSAVIPYGVFGFQVFHGGTDGGYQNTSDMSVDAIWTEARPTTEWQTIAVPIGEYQADYEKVGRIILTCNVTEDQPSATTLFIRDIRLVKSAEYVGVPGTEPDAEELPDNENMAPITVLSGASNVDGVTGSDEPAGDGFMLVHPSDETLSRSTEVVYGDGEASVRYTLPATSTDIGRGFHILLSGGVDVRGYDRIEIIAKAEKNMVYGFFGMQILYGGESNEEKNMALAANASPTTEWQVITVDIKSVSKLFSNVGRLIMTCNVPEGAATEDNVIYFDSIRLINSGYDHYEAYDGSKLVDTDLKTDSVELTDEYVKNRDTALKFNISSGVTAGHNIKIPVNYDCTRFNQLEVTLYLSDWTEFSYFGWQLHYGELAQGGLDLRNLEGIGKGWGKITYDLTSYKDYLDLIHLFFTVNFEAGAEKDLFVVIETVEFRVADEPATAYLSLADQVPPKINYIKYYNLENEAKIGDVVDLSGITVSDNEDSAPVMTIAVTKDGQAVEMTGKRFTVAEAGTYDVTLTARDASGNESKVVLHFTAPAAEGGGKSGCGSFLGGGLSALTGILVLVACTVAAGRKSGQK